MLLKKNIKVGKVKIYFIFNNFNFFFLIYLSSNSNELEGNYTDIKILDKISSKNTLIKLKNGEDKKYKDLLIKSIKCKNSEFDDNPDVTAYIQVKDLTKINNNECFCFQWMDVFIKSINSTI